MKINVTRSSMPAYEEYCEEIKSLWESRWLTNNGEKHQRLEKELTNYLGCNAISLATNGHLALELALKALDLEGDVITTPFTFASTTQAIVRCGLRPVFCDVDPVTLTLDPAKIEALITERTAAIVPVHVYGNICNVDAIEKIAEKYGIKVIYDAAHAFGVTYNGRGIGSYGDASMFSFHATKVFHTIEGGCVCCKDPATAERINRLKNFGIAAEDNVPDVSGNAKMNEFQAAMGLCNLRHISEEIEKRKNAALHYQTRLRGVPGLKLKEEQRGVVSNYAYFPVLFREAEFGANREQVLAALAEKDIFARRYFYPLTSSFSCYGGAYPSADTPTALYASQNILTLPLYADITAEDIDRICDTVLSLKK